MTNGVAPDAPKEVFGMFTGPINQAAAQRISNAMTLAINNGVEGIHLLFQSDGIWPRAFLIGRNLLPG